MAITEKLSEIASAIRIKQGYDADDFENHPIAFNNFASAIAELNTSGSFEDSITACVESNQAKTQLNIEITTTCTEVTA